MPHSTYLPEKMGRAWVEPNGAFEAGSYQSFTVVYEAGYFGIDDSGAVKIVHRFASDMGRPQFSDPTAANYVTVEASNGAVLDFAYDGKQNIRPWDKTLYIKVVRGYLRDGDRIIVRFGDAAQGSPGIRLQTFAEDTFEFRVLVDAIATYNFVELPVQPTIAIVSGPPVLWKAIMPTARKVGDVFKISIKGEDKWGNPSNQCARTLMLKPSLKINGLPETVTTQPGQFFVECTGLSVAETGLLTVDILDDDGQVVCVSNPMQVEESLSLLPYWGDLHGQSEETIGTNSAREFYEFARDLAFLDACSHQGNDFQITNDFWKTLNDLSKEFNQDGEFIVFPGYEWSGNTGLGGDRNVLYLNEGRPIFRSSHALIDDLTDLDTDANSAEDLFDRLENEDCVVFAHIGGRYADIKMAHDARLECSVEVHSAWGTFEWLIDDAFEQGYRVGIVSNSDGHKGRPGASHPGATSFGSYGGLTCMLASALTRPALADALRQRHHYATTGCRMVLSVDVELHQPGVLYDRDPALGAAKSQPATIAMMGDIIATDADQVTLKIESRSASPVERIEIRNGLKPVEIFKPYSHSDLGRRIRIVWEGSEYRGRGRETHWNGSLDVSGNRIQKLNPINRYNIDKRFDQISNTRAEWQALTTGGLGGFDVWLDDAQSGTLSIDTDLVKCDIQVSDIGMDDLVFDAGGIGRRIRVFRMPDDNPHTSVDLTRQIKLRKGQDNPLYICLTQEDGHYVWSSPVYLINSTEA